MSYKKISIERNGVLLEETDFQTEDGDNLFEMTCAPDIWVFRNAKELVNVRNLLNEALVAMGER